MQCRLIRWIKKMTSIPRRDPNRSMQVTRCYTLTTTATTIVLAYKKRCPIFSKTPQEKISWLKEGFINKTSMIPSKLSIVAQRAC